MVKQRGSQRGDHGVARWTHLHARYRASILPLSRSIPVVPTMKIAALLLALLLAAPLSVAQDEPTKQDTPVETAADQKVVVADDLVTALEAAENFTILVKALRDTGLDEALSGTETFTLFAPTDEAFQKLPAGTLDGLTADELVGILRYHVLAGTVTAADAAELTSAPTVGGDEVEIASGEALTVNDATVTEADIEVSNGVIHVIDTVLVPSAADAPLEGQAAGGQASDEMDDTTSDDDGYDDDQDNGQNEEDDDQDNSEASPEPTDDQR